MAASQETFAPAWSIRLATDLSANDQTARNLVGGFTEEQLNWQPAPGCWSVGQCLEHLCVTTNAICGRSLTRLGRSLVLQWRRSLPDGWGAGLSATLRSPRRAASALPLRERSGPDRVPTFRFSIVFCLATKHAVTLSSALAATT